MYYNSWKNKKIIKVGMFILIICLIVFTVCSVKYNRKTTFVEDIIKDGVSSIINITSKPFKIISEKWDIFIKADKIYDEYVTLKKEQSYIDKDIVINELKAENNELRDILGIQNSILEYEEINAAVIHRGADYWLDTITIDKGKKSGVDVNMAVVVSGGLIGYISSAGDYTSTVTLLTKSNIINKISVKVEVAEGIYSYGLLYEYDKENNLYLIEGISEYYEIPINATVTTTGLTERFPSGITVGTVKSISTDSYDLTKIVMVTPIIDLNDITYVTVLKREAISQ